jgi:glycosyltransferase involved in cell wall biosynthesis
MALRPLLTIAIPTYNRSDAVRQALASICSQISPRLSDKIEIIVIDNASTDGTLPGLSRLYGETDYIRLLSNSENIGPERNILRCSREADGEFLWLFGSDDILLDGSLAHIVDVLEQGDFDLIYMNKEVRDRDLISTIVPAEHVELVDRQFSSVQELCEHVGFYSRLSFMTAVICRRSYYVAIDPEPFLGFLFLPACMLLAAFRDRPCLFLARVLVCHRQHNVGSSLEEWEADTGKSMRYLHSNGFARLMNELMRLGLLSADQIARMREVPLLQPPIGFVDMLIHYYNLRLDLGEIVPDDEAQEFLTFVRTVDPSKVSQLMESRSLPQQISGYRIDRIHNQFLAVSPLIADAALFREHIGERELPGLLYGAATLEELRGKLDFASIAIESREIKFETVAGDHAVFVIGGNAIALPSGMGGVDLTDFAALWKTPGAVIGGSVSEVLERLGASPSEAATMPPTGAPTVRSDRDFGAHTKGFRIDRVNGRYIAVAEALQGVPLFRERIGERDLPNLIYRADTRDELIAKLGHASRGGSYGNAGQPAVAAAVRASSRYHPEFDASGLVSPVAQIWHAQVPPQYPEWISIEFDRPQIVRRLMVQCQEQHIDRAPSDMVLEAFVGGEWFTILSVSHAKWWDSGTWLDWKIAQEIESNRFRLTIFDNNGADLLTIQKIVLVPY